LLAVLLAVGARLPLQLLCRCCRGACNRPECLCCSNTTCHRRTVPRDDGWQVIHGGRSLLLCCCQRLLCSSFPEVCRQRHPALALPAGTRRCHVPRDLRWQLSCATCLRLCAVRTRQYSRLRHVCLGGVALHRCSLAAVAVLAVARVTCSALLPLLICQHGCHT